MGVKERLIQYLDIKNISKSEFGRAIGVSNAYVTSIRKSIDNEKIKAIALTYPELNIKWLLYGEGEMLLNNKKDDEEIIQQHSSTIEIPLSVWQVIQDQAECIKLKDNQMDEILKSRDKQIDEMFAFLKAKDQQISDFITILKQQINQKGEDVGNVSGVAI